MIALGVDPGTESSGYGLVRIEGPRAWFMACGEVESTLTAFRALIRQHAPDVAGIEGVAIMRLAAAKQLLETQHVSTMARCAAEAEGVPYDVATSDVWRRALGVPHRRSGSTTDAKVEAMLRMRLAGMPGPGKTNSHKRDGLGVALWAGLEFRGRR